MTWRHPVLGEVLGLPRSKQPKKVWKHLYDPEERWWVLCEVDPRELYEEALGRGCPPRGESKVMPRVHWQVVRLLEVHHDRAYGPAYRAEMESPGARWAPKAAEARRWTVRTPGGVIVIVQNAPDCRVVTAYRPHPPVTGVVWGEDDIQRQADRTFGKDTGMHVNEVPTLEEELRRLAGLEAFSARDAWWLALTVGEGRARAAREPALAAPLAVAEGALARVPVDVIDAIVAGLDSDQLLDRLADGLKQEEPEDVEAALSDLEDALVALETLGHPQRARALLEAAQALIAWVPPEFEALARQAALRRADLDPNGAASALWSKVDESLLGAQLRELPPARRPVSSLVEGLLPRPSVLKRLVARRDRGLESLRAQVQRTITSLDVSPPVPVMGDRGSADRPWEVRGPGVSTREGWIRAFVVDDDASAGYDVTELLSSGGTIWQLERPGQDATLVVVAGDAPLPDGDLEALLQAVEAREDVVVLEQRISRPM